MTINIIKSILINDPRIASAFIYGSYPDNEDHNDIDVGVFTRDKFAGKERFDLEYELSKQIANQLPGNLEIDVRVLNDAPDSFLFNVFQGLFLFTKDNKVEDLMEHIILKCLDEQYFKDQYLIQAYGDR